MIRLDFESRSRIDIFEVGAWAYSMHPSTEILCLAWALDDGHVSIMDKEEINTPVFARNYTTLLDEWIKTENIVAYNAFFEQCMYQNILVRKMGWPEIPIKRWRCSMAKALAHSLPQSLKNAGLALRADVLKSDEGHRVMMKMCKPKADGTWHEDPEDLQKLYDYCKSDVEAERSIDRLIPDLNPKEQEIWFLDQLINRRGVTLDREAIEKACEFIDIHTEKLNAEVNQVSNGKLEKVSGRTAVLQWCEDKGVTVADYSKKTVEEVLEQDDIPDDVRTVLETKISLGKTSVKKYLAMRNSISDDNKIRDLFIYHGANTGRWTGKLIQLHNLPRGKEADPDTAISLLKKLNYDDFAMIYPDIMDTLSSCIRGMIVADPGKDLLIADYASIEARVVMWLAGEEYGLNQFRNKVDLYVDMAKVIYGISTVDKLQRALGKSAVLGCGYGLGPKTFLKNCKNNGLGIDETLAEKAVASFRGTYKAIPRFWYQLENAAIECVKTKEDVTCGKLRWEYSPQVLLCHLPSGRTLKYNSPSLDYIETPWGERKMALHYMGLTKAKGQTTTKWDRQHTYGGKLVENVTQAVARDILAEAIYRCEEAKLEVAAHVHDEIVVQVPEGTGSLEQFEKILCFIPKWATGLPISAAAFRTNRYRKD